jgi:hypothetical protein
MLLTNYTVQVPTFQPIGYVNDVLLVTWRSSGSRISTATQHKMCLHNQSTFSSFLYNNEKNRTSSTRANWKGRLNLKNAKSISNTTKIITTIIAETRFYVYKSYPKYRKIQKTVNCNNVLEKIGVRVMRMRFFFASLCLLHQNVVQKEATKKFKQWWMERTSPFGHHLFCTPLNCCPSRHALRITITTTTQ